MSQTYVKLSHVRYLLWPPSNFFTVILSFDVHKGTGKAVPLQAWSGPEGSRKLRFPDYMKTAQDGGKVSALRTGRL
jgi:hypothetical protein